MKYKLQEEKRINLPQLLILYILTTHVADLKYFILCMHSVRSNRSTPLSCKDHKVWVCGKWLVINTYSITISQDVSIQVQSVPYQTQPGLNPRLWMSYRDTSVTIIVNKDTSKQLINPHYTGRNLVSYRCQYRHYHTLKALNIPFKKYVLPGRVKCVGPERGIMVAHHCRKRKKLICVMEGKTSNQLINVSTRTWYNLVIYQHLYTGCDLVSYNVNTDTSNPWINVSTSRWSTMSWLINATIQGSISLAVHVNVYSYVSTRTYITSYTLLKEESQSTEVYFVVHIRIRLLTG